MPIDTAPRDTDEPRRRISPGGVVARAVAKRAFEGVAREVVRVGPWAYPVRDVGIYGADQRLRAPQRVATSGQPRCEGPGARRTRAGVTGGVILGGGGARDLRLHGRRDPIRLRARIGCLAAALSTRGRSTAI